MNSQITSILLVGCGNMGSAILHGWLQQGISPDVITVLTPSHLDIDPSINVVHSVTDIQQSPDIVVFAVKPQILDQILGNFSTFDSLMISVAAGKPISFYESVLGPDKPIIRTMPNLPSTVGKGITAAYANTYCTESHKEHLNHLLSAIGTVVWLDYEADIDSVTALSGSGPGYIFYLMECFVNAGIEAGLSKDVVNTLVKQTFYGTSYLALESNDNLSRLRENVTSKGGTTQAGLDVLMDPKFNLSDHIKHTVLAAKKRAKELAE